MANKTILFGGLVLALVFALSAAPVLACDGGGDVVFNGSMVVGSFRLMSGGTSISYNGLVNVNIPYVFASQINPYLTETVQVNTLTLNVSSTSLYSGTKYIDLSSARIIPTSPVVYVCDIKFGDIAKISSATIEACSAYNVPVCDESFGYATDAAAE